MILISELVLKSVREIALLLLKPDKPPNLFPDIGPPNLYNSEAT